MQPGTRIAERFEVERLAGSGGMGTVYRAIDRTTDAPVAVKLLGRAEASDRERFAREARLLSELRHPGVVRYVAHGETSEGERYIAMEWLEGLDLADKLATEGPLGAAEALALIRRVADALAAAHRREVVHRDIKPSNLFLPDGDTARVKVLDFGIARGGAGAAPLTRTGLMVGTPGYMAPEQTRSQMGVDARVDVFAMGCVLFECLTGRAPFVGESVMSLLSQVLLDETPRVRDLCPDLPQALDDLVARLMAKDRDGRPSGGAEVSEEIAALGAMPEVAHAPRSTRQPTLTTAEQRLRCVVLVTGLDAGADGASEDGVAADRTLDDQATVAVGGLDQSLIELSHLVSTFRGRLEALGSGTLVATIEGGGVATDQAARAARCALALQQKFVEARIAIATGRASSSTRGVTSVSDGGPASRAAALIDACTKPSGISGVLLDDATAGLLDGRFELATTSAGRVLRAERGALEGERRLLGKPTPCVGREREIGTLQVIFDECVEEPVARVVLLTGPAGTGKSRVRHEFLRRAKLREDGSKVWLGRGDAIRAGAPLALLAQAVRGAAGISGSEPIEARRKKLAEHVASVVAAEDAVRVTEFLGELTGVFFAGGSSPQLAAAKGDALVMADQMRRAFEDLVAATCKRGPLILVLEDLHWGDLPTIKFVDTTLRNLEGAPLLVLATARPEVDDIFPNLWAERSPQQIRVGHLTPKASEKLVRHVLGASVDDAAIVRIVAHAGGHPLHLEEILRAYAEGNPDALPDTVLAMVQARIESLEPEARRLLRAASIFGRAFWAGGVSALASGKAAGADVSEWLVELCDREWTDRHDTSRFPDEDEYGFQQDVVRESAYAMLTDVDRALGHRLAGAWLEQAGEHEGLVLARHYELGGDEERAVVWYGAAADQALESDDFAGAVAHCERAVALAAEGAALGKIRATQAEAHVYLGEFEPARERGGEAMRLLEPGSIAWLRSVGAVAQASGKLGAVDVVVRVANALLDLQSEKRRGVAYAAAASPTVIQLLIGAETKLAETILENMDALARDLTKPDPAIEGHVERARGARFAFGGDPGLALVSLRKASALFEAAGDLRSACSLRKTQGWYAGECGLLEEGERALRASIASAERLGLPNLVAHAKHDLGSPLLRLGKLEEARATETEALRVFAKQGDKRLESGAHAVLSAVAMKEGKHEEAEREARTSLTKAPTDPVRVASLSFLAAVLLADGRAEDALETAEEGLRLLEACSVTEEGISQLYLVHAEALAARGDNAAAKRAIDLAKEKLEERAARISDEALRDTFLTRIEENARTIALAKEWGEPRSL